MEFIAKILNDLSYGPDWANFWEKIIVALKTLPFMPFYFLGMFVGWIGMLLQSITGDLITDDMLHNIIVAIQSIGTFFVIK